MSNKVLYDNSIDMNILIEKSKFNLIEHINRLNCKEVRDYYIQKYGYDRSEKLIERCNVEMQMLSLLQSNKHMFDIYPILVLALYKNVKARKAFLKIYEENKFELYKIELESKYLDIGLFTDLDSEKEDICYKILRCFYLSEEKLPCKKIIDILKNSFKIIFKNINSQNIINTKEINLSVDNNTTIRSDRIDSFVIVFYLLYLSKIKKINLVFDETEFEFLSIIKEVLCMYFIYMINPIINNTRNTNFNKIDEETKSKVAKLYKLLFKDSNIITLEDLMMYYNNSVRLNVDKIFPMKLYYSIADEQNFSLKRKFLDLNEIYILLASYIVIYEHDYMNFNDLIVEMESNKEEKEKVFGQLVHMFIMNNIIKEYKILKKYNLNNSDLKIKDIDLLNDRIDNLNKELLSKKEENNKLISQIKELQRKLKDNEYKSNKEIKFLKNELEESKQYKMTIDRLKDKLYSISESNENIVKENVKIPDNLEYIKVIIVGGNSDWHNKIKEKLPLKNKFNFIEVGNTTFPKELIVNGDITILKTTELKHSQSFKVESLAKYIDYIHSNNIEMTILEIYEIINKFNGIQ